ncbi:hypothetical protein OH786_14930 [Streptomyces atratus]|uniref:Uncharacterized protein n=1 Tax=Streptomyces atratus TaxID=1893 RepID=A0A1K2AXP3_STRAR|nr:hypothetical protein [Streptomyces atratus]SFX90628.1 hypothetical protein SAMN02787144_1007312 [Streptomyces atratus]
MSTLKRAPRECGSWRWDLYDTAAPGLESALSVAARMCDVLARVELLAPIELKYSWYVLDVGPTGITSTLELTRPLGEPSVPSRVRGSRPSAYPSADIADINVIGPGTWIDAVRQPRKEPQLVGLSLSTAPTGLSAELSVHHDIWGWYDFAGRPHPEVYRNNAPRLTAALEELVTLLDAPPEPGEPTYFGAATPEGLATPDAYEDGLGPDLTSRL